MTEAWKDAAIAAMHIAELGQNQKRFCELVALAGIPEFLEAAIHLPPEIFH